MNETNALRCLVLSDNMLMTQLFKSALNPSGQHEILNIPCHEVFKRTALGFQPHAVFLDASHQVYHLSESLSLCLAKWPQAVIWVYTKDGGFQLPFMDSRVQPLSDINVLLRFFGISGQKNTPELPREAARIAS